MKRLLKFAIPMAISLVLAVAFTACNLNSGGVNYGGTYTEVSDAAQIEQLLQDVDNALAKTEAWAGYKVVISLEMSYGGESYTMSGTGYVTIIDDKVEMSCELSGKMLNETATIKEYYKDGWLYMYAKTGSEVEKYKVNTGDLFEYTEADFSLDQVYSDFEDLAGAFDVIEGSGLKVSVTGDSGARNIKFASEEFNMEIIVALNADGEVIGIKMQMDIDMDGMTMKMGYEYESYSGTIKFPNDLDSYSVYAGE